MANCISVVRTIIFIVCLLPTNAGAAVITTITCPDPATYIEVTQNVNSYLISTRPQTTPPSKAELAKMIGVIITERDCNIDHSPGYSVLDSADFDGIMFVKIQNKFYSGWMKADDYKQLYLNGTPQ